MSNFTIKLPSNKKFGYTFSIIFLMVASYFFFLSSHKVGYIFFTLAGFLFVITLINPDILYIFNKKWMQLGILLGKIVSPIVLGILFFGLFTPFGLIMRIFGRDELFIKLKKKDSYWKLRQHGSKKINFNMQF